MSDTTKKPDAFVRVFRGIWSGLDGIRKVVHLFLMLFVLLFFISSLSGTAPSMPGSAMLLLRPTGALVEELTGSAYDQAIAELLDSETPQTLISDVVASLDYAKDDDRIKGVHLELSGFAGASVAKLELIANALDEFRASGKPIIATADFYSQGSYYLAAHADEIYMHPQGVAFIQGYGLYRSYFSEAIDKLKIDWNVFRVGKYKSFVEPYTRMDMSDESREAELGVVTQLWDVYTLDVESARGLEQGTIREMVDNFDSLAVEYDGDLAAVATATGLVDELKGRREVRERLIEIAGPDSQEDDNYSAVAHVDYLRQMQLLKQNLPKDDKVAIIVVAGEILGGSQAPGLVGADSASALLRRAKRDDAVKAVVLRVDSPGGSAFASEIIGNAVTGLRDAGKPVVASMSGAAASGGYWIAAAADQVFASPSTVTGSIGVFGMIPTYQRTAAYLGVNVDGVGSTPWAGAFRPDRELSESTRRLMQQTVNHNYDDFLEHVASRRNMSIEAVHEVAQGRIWTGLDALNHRLIDELGGLEEAIAAAAEAAGLGEGSYDSVFIAEPLSPMEQFIVDFLGTVKAVGVDPALFVSKPRTLERLARQFESMLDPLLRFNDPQGIYTHCFCRIE